MKVKTILFTLILSVNILSTKSQTLKTFSGQFADNRVQSGKANYTYFEDESSKEWIKDGKFSYALIGTGDFKGFNQTISGSLKTGKREGIWSSNMTFVDFDIENGIKASSGKNIYSTGTVSLTGSYVNGQPNGTWTYKLSVKKRSKFLVQGQMKWDPYGSVKTRTLVYNFKNGVIVGNVSIMDEFYKFTLSGTFDNNGVMIGNWKRIDEGNSMEMTYTKGCLVSYIGRSVGTGEVNSKGGKPGDVGKLSLWSATEPNKNAELNFKIDTLSLLNNDGEPVYRYLYYHIFNDEYFLYSSIKGDLTYDKKIKGAYRFEVRELVGIDQIDAVYVKNYKQAESEFAAKDYENSLKHYKYVLDNNKYKLNQKDLIYLKVQVQKSDSLFKISSGEKEIFKKEFEVFYATEYGNLKDYYKIFWDNYKPVLKDSYGEDRYPESHPTKGSKGGNDGMFTVIPTDENQVTEKENPVTRESTLFSKDDLVKAYAYQNYLNALKRGYNRENWNNWDKESRDKFYKKIEKRKSDFYEFCK